MKKESLLATLAFLVSLSAQAVGASQSDAQLMLSCVKYRYLNKDTLRVSLKRDTRTDKTLAFIGVINGIGIETPLIEGTAVTRVSTRFGSSYVGEDFRLDVRDVPSWIDEDGNSQGELAATAPTLKSDPRVINATLTCTAYGESGQP